MLIMAWIKTIADSITAAFNGVRVPVPPIPPILLMCEILNRPGMSAMSLTAAIIARLPEMGFDTGVNEDGTANMVNMFVKIMCEEIVKEIKNNAVVNCSIPPGALNITGVAAGVGGGAVTASNASFTGINGIIR